MQVRIHSHGFHPDQELRQGIERRLDLSLGRFGPRINDIQVWLSDENGPRGGIDKSVRMELELSGARELRVKQTGSDWQTAVDMAAGRLGRITAREVDRRRNRRIHSELMALSE
jgi:putative sigma-54 modulation protein